MKEIVVLDCCTYFQIRGKVKIVFWAEHNLTSNIYLTRKWKATFMLVICRIYFLCSTCCEALFKETCRLLVKIISLDRCLHLQPKYRSKSATSVLYTSEITPNVHLPKGLPIWLIDLHPNDSWSYEQQTPVIFLNLEFKGRYKIELSIRL